MESFRVVCLNDKHKPKEFIGDWIEKGEVYTVIEAKYLARQRNTIGYRFAELNISEDSMYQFFLANRFRPYSDDDAEAEKAVEELLKETLELVEL